MRRGAAAVLFAPTLLAIVLLPEIRQPSGYHDFVDRRAILDIPNFWNVISNLPFLAVAIWGLRAFRAKVAFTEAWERTAYAVVLAGTALTAFGSANFHWDPTPATLFLGPPADGPDLHGIVRGAWQPRRHARQRTKPHISKTRGLTDHPQSV